MILNLKGLNTYVKYYHFKMDTLWSVIKLVTPNCFMASVDLKDAYYSVPVSPSSQKLLKKFLWQGQLYQYTCLPNGLYSCCPRKFPKLLKPVYTVLRKRGHVSSGYVDDAYLQGDTYDDCACNVVDTVDLFSTLGLVIHPDKSVFEPTQILEFWGFLLNSIMRITRTLQKVEKIMSACALLLNKSNRVSIREVSRVIGLLVSSFPGVMFGPLYYRALEHDKIIALKLCRGNFDSYMRLSLSAIEDLNWWIASLPTAYNEVSHGSPDIVINTDASLSGWGGGGGC